MTPIDPATLRECLDAAQEAARRGAQQLLDWRQRFQVREKGKSDLVTDADLASQRAVQECLLGRFPAHQFLGEESVEGSRGRPGPEAAPTWIVDPLDGTTNYVHDFPFYCVSIGLLAAGELVVGVVYEPVRQEMFSAAKGLGAFLNGSKLQVSACDSLSHAMLSTGFPPDVRGQEEALDWWRYFSMHSQSVRRTGSTALNLAYVAAGRFDGYWAFDNFAWDVAGGIVLVREAGGLVSNADGSAYDPFTPDALAGNPAIHAQLLAAMNKQGTHA